MFEIRYKFRNVSLRFVAGSEAELPVTFDRLARMGIERNQCRVKRI
jgi:hypothetical protein